MRAALIALTILLLPAALFAEPTVGVYFTGSGMTYSPTAYEEFYGYVLVNNFECYVSAAEFAIGTNALPTQLVVTGFSVPEGSVFIGDPMSDIAISYWPPLNGYDGTAHLLCTLKFLAKKGCGQMNDLMVSVIPAPEAVPVPGVLGTCWPDQEIHFLTGLNSIICPSAIGVQDKTWGSIKSLYEK